MAILIQHQTHSHCAQNPKVVSSRSKMSTKTLKFRQSIRIEYYSTPKHPGVLACSERPFLGLGSIWLAIAYLTT